MKVLLRLGVFLTCSVGPPVAAQITVNNAFQPEVGTSFVYKTDLTVDSTFFNSLLSGSGGPILWDFSSRTYGTGYTEIVVSSDSTPSIDLFPEANLVLQSGPDFERIWALSRSDPDSFWRLGVVSLSFDLGLTYAAFQDSTPDYTFPFTVGSEWISHSSIKSINYPDSQNYTISFDTAQYSVNAWGTLKYGDREMPVLRVVTTQRLTYLSYIDDVLVQTGSSDFTTINFVGAGFTIPISVKRTGPGDVGSFYSTALESFLIGVTDVREVDSDKLPNSFSMEQNYPNPFNPTTEIRFSVPVRSDIQLKVYNLSGQTVRTLVDASLGAGEYVTSWDGTDKFGYQVASGVYFYRIEAGTFSQARKMVLLK